MRAYELVVIAHPELDENAFNDVINRVTGWITQDGGEISKTEVWGRRKLAYPIRRQIEGQYVLFFMKMAPKLGAQLERNLRLFEPVLRFMLVAK
jgi:small subunit ribosomal protein S6